MTAGIVVPAPHRRGGRATSLLAVDLPIGEAVQHLVEGDRALETRQRSTEAVVRATPEGDVLADLAMEVESLRVAVAALVVVG